MARAVVLALVTAALGACADGKVAPIDSAPNGQIDALLDGNGCATQPCSILPQCGCNGNTACDVDLVDEDGAACRSINAAGTETASCGGPAECDRGFACVGGVSFRSCKKYCSGDADCGAPRGKCIYTLTNDNGDPIQDVPDVCSSNCEPTDTTAAGCPATMKCTLFGFTKNMMPVNVADCSPAGTMMQGGDCNSATNTGIEARCAKGYQCVKLGSETVYKCRRLCSAPGTTTGCGANTCTAFTPAVTLGTTSYGVCGP